MQDIYEGRWGGDTAADVLAKHRGLPIHAWAPPRMVSPPVDAPALLPVRTLMQVEIAIYPKTSCDGAAAGAAGRPRSPERGPPMTREELERLGTPASIDRIWMVPGKIGTGAPFAIGPEWLGNFLREAGTGATVYFPAYRNCAISGADPEQLPRRVFYFGGDALRIDAATPFTARVVNACRADIVVHQELLQSWHIPFWRGVAPTVPLKLRRTRDSASVSARCVGGDVRFELGPFTSDTPYDRHPDPRPSLVSTVPPAVP